MYELVFAIVNKGFAEEVIDAAIAAGAQGGTVMHARGASRRTETVYGVRIEPEKDVVLLVVAKEKCKAIMQGIYEKAGLNTHGSGICFALPVDEVVGLKVYEKPKTEAAAPDAAAQNTAAAEITAESADTTVENQENKEEIK